MIAENNVQNLDNRRETAYHIAQHSGDYRAARAFLASEQVDTDGLSFPTMIARQNGEVVGVMSTIPRKDMILAGPLVVKSDRPRPLTALRLVELYDSTMRNMGISAYLVWVPLEDEKFRQMLERTGGFEWTAGNSGGFLYTRKLIDEVA